MFNGYDKIMLEKLLVNGQTNKSFFEMICEYA